jgi:rubredoxin
MEGVINPLAVRDPWRCSACGLEWLVYDLDEGPPRCVRGETARTWPPCGASRG